MNIAQLLARSARSYGTRPAVYLGEHLLYDYRTLSGRVARIAGYLSKSLGLKPGDRVAMYMGNAPEYIEILYAVLWSGLVAVPVNYKLHSRELETILKNSEARLLFACEEKADELSPLLKNCPFLEHVLYAGSHKYQTASQFEAVPLTHRTPDDLAWLFYTSGTTGSPKGVMLSHRNLLAMTTSMLSDVCDVSHQDCSLYAAPFSHGAGLYNFAYVLKAARHVFPESGGFEPEEVMCLADELGDLCFFAAPTMVKRLVEFIVRNGGYRGGLKTIIYGGGPMYVEDLQEGLRVIGNHFAQIYGQGETPMTITSMPKEHFSDTENPKWLAHIASVGIAQSQVEVRVVDANGNDVGENEVGEIVVRGATVMSGYWKNELATKEAIRDGWLWTGDLGTLDTDGFLTLKDRSKDVIISGGSNIYPREVEEVLLMHPLVREVSVVGKPDPEWGETVVAFIVGDGPTKKELDELCVNHIARFKRPKEYFFVSSLPKNNYGKVVKTELRQLLERIDKQFNSQLIYPHF